METGPQRARVGTFDLYRTARSGLLWSMGFALLFGIALYYVSTFGSFDQIQAIGGWTIAAVLGLSLLNYLLRSIRWQIFCRTARIHIPFHTNLIYYVAGFAFATTPGKVGEVLRLWLLNKNHGAAYSRTLSFLIMDRLMDAVPLAILCVFGIAQFADHLWLMVAFIAVMIGVVVLLQRPNLLVMLVKLTYARVGRNPRLFARGLRLVRTLRLLTGPYVFTMALLLGCAGWSAEVVGSWLVLNAIGADIDLAATAFVFCAGMIVGSLPIFPGGLGGTEGAMVALLLVRGVDLGVAVTATAIIRLATLGFAVVLGFLALLYLGVRRSWRPAASPAA